MPAGRAFDSEAEATRAKTVLIVYMLIMNGGAVGQLGSKLDDMIWKDGDAREDGGERDRAR